jgi:hypothetical protein
MIGKPTGGPAFPVVTANDMWGMTLRDYFAAAALGQALAMEIERRRSMIEPPPFDVEGVAMACYDVADAMIAERDK